MCAAEKEGGSVIDTDPSRAITSSADVNKMTSEMTSPAITLLTATDASINEPCLISTDGTSASTSTTTPSGVSVLISKLPEGPTKPGARTFPSDMCTFAPRCITTPFSADVSVTLMTCVPFSSLLTVTSMSTSGDAKSPRGNAMCDSFAGCTRASHARSSRAKDSTSTSPGRKAPGITTCMIDPETSALVAENETASPSYPVYGAPGATTASRRGAATSTAGSTWTASPSQPSHSGAAQSISRPSSSTVHTSMEPVSPERGTLTTVPISMRISVRPGASASPSRDMVMTPSSSIVVTRYPSAPERNRACSGARGANSEGMRSRIRPSRGIGFCVVKARVTAPAAPAASDARSNDTFCSRGTANIVGATWYSASIPLESYISVRIW
mmetsp:Transcript_9616/g.23413  ORF Transcript_9616/g.23413 Transcript_9616/m.23413 type:complete len:385 (+) Transcript_9616:1096-2250(+)